MSYCHDSTPACISPCQTALSRPLIILSSLLLLVAAGPGCQRHHPTPPALAQAAYPEAGTVQRLNPGLDNLIPPGTRIQLLARGFSHADGPVWHPEEKALLFSDTARNVVLKWQPFREVTTYLFPSGYRGVLPTHPTLGSSGLTFDRRGRLLLCEHGNRCVGRIGFNTSHAILAQRFHGLRFNSPHDATVGSDNAIYFTDPPHGLPRGVNDPGRELPFHGVYRCSPEGRVSLVTARLSRPDGIAWAVDESELYVANGDPRRPVWMAYTLDDSGRVAKERVLFDGTLLLRQFPGLPSGCKVDREGNLWATGPGGVLILTPSGEHWGTVRLAEPATNCAWGGARGQDLYITTSTSLVRIHTAPGGVGPHPKAKK